MRILSLCLLFVVASNHTIAADVDWMGTIDAGAVKLRLQLTTNGETSATSGKLVSIDQGNALIPLDSLSIKSGTVKFAAARLGIRFEGKLAPNNKSFSGTFNQGPQKFPLTMKQVNGDIEPDKLIETWVGTLQAGPQKLRLQFRILEQHGGKRVTKFDSLTQNVEGIAAEINRDDKTLNLEIKSLRATFTGKLNADRTSVKGIWSQGVPLPMSFKKVDAPEAAKIHKRPQTPKPPFPYAEKQVKFVSAEAGIELAGTLTIPQGSGPHPAVVLVSGSGPQDRDETILGHKPFHVIADYLSRQGIAVLRYDDRGVGQSTGTFGTATTVNFAQDALGAVRFLRDQRGLNPNAVGIVGHSEGGMIGPMVAADHDEVSFVVMLSGPAVNGREILDKQSQLIAAAAAAGAAEPEIETAATLRNAVIDAIVGKPEASDWKKLIKDAVTQTAEDLPQEKRKELLTPAVMAQYQALGTPWMRYFVSYDPLPTLKRVKVPVLALTGDLDLQVWHLQNAPLIKSAIKSHPKSHAKVFPGLNHLFQPAKTGSVSEYRSIETTFSTEALEVMATWIAEVATE